MDAKELNSPATHQRWGKQEQFLLLPGDGLILVSGDGAIQFFDNRARLLIGPASKQCLGQPLDTVWPAVADLIEHHTLDVHAFGPLDTTVPWRTKTIPVRLFRSDGGMGAVLLGQRGGESQQACERLLMHQRILEQVRDAMIVTTAEPMASPGPILVYANAAAQRQTGYRLSELVARTPRIF
jgi:PAS domain-containing protein